MKGLDICEKAVAFCENHGVQAEVLSIERKEIIVILERNDIKLCIKQNTAGIGIRTLIRNSVGFSSCNSLEEGKVMKAARRAIRMSKNTPPVPYSVLASPAPLPAIAGLYDPEALNFDEERAIHTAEKMITAAREDPRVSVDTGEFAAVLREKAICTSPGISAVEKKSMFSWFLLGMALERHEVGSFEYQYGCTTQVGEVHVEKTARTLAEHAVANLHPKKIAPFSGDVILGPEAVLEVLCDPVVFSLNANNVYRGQSQLTEKHNCKIASPLMTIADNAVVPGDFSSSAFDREGTPHQTLTMVRKGVLESFMYDSLAASRENRSSTGNAAGSVREIPRIGITNFMIKNTSHSLETLIEETERGLLVPRFSGTSDEISGDFSGAVKGAQLIRSGEIQHPVKEAVISGNVFEILPTIEDISKETLRYSRMVLPYVKIPGMQIIA
jgi:PmbA protein